MNTDLYIRAERQGISVISSELPLTKSISADINGELYIGIDLSVINTGADERVHLAHELGHCETGAFYNYRSPIDNRRWYENMANVRAYDILVPYDDLQKAIKKLGNDVSTWDLAEHFNVTEAFIKKAITYYVSKENF